MRESLLITGKDAIALQQYKSALEIELDAIISYWRDKTIDPLGGFYGQIDENNIPNPEAPKGIVLNSRILWTFSTASRFSQNPACLPMAHRAFQYIMDHFIDDKYGGVYWTVDHQGKMLDGKKQVYGLAFCIYGMSAFYAVTGNKNALKLARELYETIELYSRDRNKSGYLESFSREWEAVIDLRLSPKDRNEKKTMNTHLHILEAYSQLYGIWPHEGLKEDIEALLRDFTRHIVDQEKGHLRLFFDENWVPKGNIISYGHDIEASWLLPEAAKKIDDKELVEELEANAITMCRASEEGLDADGGLWYETEEGHLVKQKHSWPQAEAMVGFFNAFEITGNRKYLELSKNSWEFTRQYIIDKSKGEWHWGIDADHLPMKGMDKVGLWKCPYHNGRACMELIRRINYL